MGVAAYIVVVELVHMTPMLSYTVNYEPCSLLVYFLAVDKIRHTTPVQKLRQ